jgi:hypothetical protein
VIVTADKAVKRAGADDGRRSAARRQIAISNDDQSGRFFALAAVRRGRLKGAANH